MRKTRMNRLVAAAIAFACGLAAWAMPTKEELMQAQELVKDLTADDVRAMKSGAKGLSPLEAYREVLAAAESGDADAMFQVALRLYFGNGVARDVEAARAMATKALDSGNLAAAAIRDLP